MFESFLLVPIAILVLLAITIAMGVKLVPQGEEWIVERLGRFHQVLKPGLNIIIPYMDSVAYKLPTKDMILYVDEQEVITRDNAVISTNALCFAKISNPAKAAYGVTDFQQAIKNVTMTSLRSIIGGMDLDEALSSREPIKEKLRESMAEHAVDWGLTVKSVEIQDIKPSDSMQRAMEMQAAAERERKAMVTRAGGAKQAAVLEAEARLEAARRDAEAQVTLAKASAQAIIHIKESVGTDTAPALYLLGEKYITAMREIANSSNAKTIVLPADIQQTLKGFLNR